MNSFDSLIEHIGFDLEENIGDGNFSKVFKTGRGTVIKFNVDSTYMRFVEMCQKHPSKFLPKIIKNYGVVGVAHDYCGEVPVYAVEMPVYTPIEHVRDRVATTSFILYTLKGILKGDDFDVSGVSDIVDTVSGNAGKYRDEDKIEFSTVLCRLAKLCGDIAEENDQHPTSLLDLHSGNVMWDSYGNLIILDPLASHNDTENDVVDSGRDFDGECTEYATRESYAARAELAESLGFCVQLLRFKEGLPSDLHNHSMFDSTPIRHVTDPNKQFPNMYDLSIATDRVSECERYYPYAV